MKTTNNRNFSILNKKAQFDYEIVETLEAGIVLTGAELKAIRAKKVDLTGSYVKIIQGEAFLINAHIAAEGLVETRKSRKLLLNKREILSLGIKQKQYKLTAIPLSMYTSGRLIKLKVALAKGKKKHEKRAQIKQRDIKREIERELSSRT